MIGRAGVSGRIVRAAKAPHVRAGEAPLDTAVMSAPAYVGASAPEVPPPPPMWPPPPAHMGAAAARVLGVRQGRRSPDSF